MSDRERRLQSRRTPARSERNEIEEGEEKSEDSPASSNWTEVGEVSPSGSNPHQDGAEESKSEGSDSDFRPPSDSNGEENALAPERLEARISIESFTMANPNPDPDEGDPAPTISIGGTSIPLIASDEAPNEVSEIAQPLLRKEQWATLDAGTKRKHFDQCKKTILEERFTMVTIVGTTLEALEDTVAVHDKLERMRHHLEQYDLLAVFDIIKHDPEFPRSSEKTVLNLLGNGSSLSIQDVAKSNLFLRQYARIDQIAWFEDSQNLVFELFQNNCDDTLNAKVFEQYSTFPKSEQGGNLYYAIMSSLIYRNTEDENINLMNMLEEFHLSNIPGEDVSKFATYVTHAYDYLEGAHSVTLPDGTTYHKFVRADFPKLLIKALKTSSTPEFNRVFDFLGDISTVAEHGAGGLGDGSTIPANATSVREILDLAQKTYLELCHLGQWNGALPSPAKSTFLTNITCWNCGETGHGANKCPKPRNQPVYDKNKKEHEEKKRQAHQDGGRGGGRGHGRKGPRRGKWAAPSPNEHNKRMIDGVLHHYNPGGNKGKGHWYPVNSPPAANPAASVPSQVPPTVADLAAQMMTMMTDDMSSVTQPTTTETTNPPTAGGLVAQQSIQDARSHGRKQALKASILQGQARLQQQLNELMDS